MKLDENECKEGARLLAWDWGVLAIGMASDILKEEWLEEGRLSEGEEGGWCK